MNKEYRILEITGMFYPQWREEGSLCYSFYDHLVPCFFFAMPVRIGFESLGEARAWLDSLTAAKPTPIAHRYP